MSYRLVSRTEESPIPHADHNFEEWNAYLSSVWDDELEAIGATRDDVGICCHDCRVVIVDTYESTRVGILR